MDLTYATTQELKERFSKKLREAVRIFYGCLPSASIIARDFNLRSRNTSPVTQESVRRWIRGISLPEDPRLKVLVNWLAIDLNAIFDSSHIPRTFFRIPQSWEKMTQQQYDLIVKFSELLLEN